MRHIENYKMNKEIGERLYGHNNINIEMKIMNYNSKFFSIYFCEYINLQLVCIINYKEYEIYNKNNNYDINVVYNQIILRRNNILFGDWYIYEHEL